MKLLLISGLAALGLIAAAGGASTPSQADLERPWAISAPIHSPR